MTGVQDERGTFVVFEGGEGSGKSTQAALLAERTGAVLTRQPGGTSIGMRIRELLLSPDTVGLSDRAEALLMAADRAQHVAELIEPTLASGGDVICDRFMASSLAYQGAGRSLGVDAVAELSLFAIDGLTPDVVFLLDVPVDVSRSRVGDVQDRLERLDDDFHQRVRTTFNALAAEHSDHWVVIDGTRPVDEVTALIDTVMHERFGWPT